MEQAMPRMIRFIGVETLVVVVSVAVISSAYIFVIPFLLEGRSTSLVMLVGLALEAYVGAYVARGYWKGVSDVSWFAAAAISVVVVAVTLYLSLLLIVNTRGE
jgi:hypothetical protein